MTNAQEQPKRRFPRFSLITLLVAVNVAGVLVWANVATHHFEMKYVEYGGDVIKGWRKGWPFV